MTVYKRVLWIAVLGVLVGQLVAIIPGLVAADPGEHGMRLMAAGHRIVIGLLLAFAVVTVVFAALTRFYWRPAPTP
jgi:uncharacterized protein HemY